MLAKIEMKFLIVFFALIIAAFAAPQYGKFNFFKSANNCEAEKFVNSFANASTKCFPQIDCVLIFWFTWTGNPYGGGFGNPYGGHGIFGGGGFSGSSANGILIKTHETPIANSNKYFIHSAAASSQSFGGGGPFGGFSGSSANAQAGSSSFGFGK